MRGTMILALVLLATCWNNGYGQDAQPTPKPTVAHFKKKKKVKFFTKAVPLEKRLRIESRSSGPQRQDFYYGDSKLDSYEDINRVIGPLNDEESNRLLKSSESKNTTGTILVVLGGLAAAGGILDVATANGTSTTTYEGIYPTTTNTPSDTTMGWILIGGGAALDLLGGNLLGQGTNDRSRAVARYNDLVGNDQEAEPSQSPTPKVVAFKNDSKSASPSSAQGSKAVSTAPSTASTEEKAFPRIGIGLSPIAGFPISDKTASEYVPSFGGEISMDIAFDKGFSLGFAADYQDFPVNQTAVAALYQQTYGSSLPAGVTFSGSWTYLPVLARVKFSFPSERSDITPYIFWGTGLAFNSASLSTTYQTQTASASTQETDLLLTQGVGVGIHPSEDIEIFAQCRLDIDFTAQNGTDTYTISSSSGNSTAKGNLSDDGPTLFMPVQAGVRFWQ